MKNIRRGTFETNSSSTHTLVVANSTQDYLPLAKHVKITWIDTDDYYTLDTLEEKVSYLVSHIANKLKYSCNDYNDLLEEIQDNYEYKQIEEYIKKTFDKEIRFPNNKNGIYDDIEYITGINHQLIPWGTGAVVEEVLNELIRCMELKNGDRMRNPDDDLDMSFEEMLDIYFKDNNYIAFGSD